MGSAQNRDSFVVCTTSIANNTAMARIGNETLAQADDHSERENTSRIAVSKNSKQNQQRFIPVINDWETNAYSGVSVGNQANCPSGMESGSLVQSDFLLDRVESWVLHQNLVPSSLSTLDASDTEVKCESAQVSPLDLSIKKASFQERGGQLPTFQETFRVKPPLPPAPSITACASGSTMFRTLTETGVQMPLEILAPPANASKFAGHLSENETVHLPEPVYASSIDKIQSSNDTIGSTSEAMLAGANYNLGTVEQSGITSTSVDQLPLADNPLPLNDVLKNKKGKKRKYLLPKEARPSANEWSRKTTPQGRAPKAPKGVKWTKSGN